MKCTITKNGITREVPCGPAIAVPEGSPNLGDKVKTFSQSFVRWAAAGFPKRAREEVKAIQEICRACPFWSEKGNLGFGECTHPRCGCTRFKPQWKTESCPIGNW